MVEVGRLSPERWSEYRRLRIEALQTDPAAFASSVEDEASLPETEWKRRLVNTLFAFSDDRPVGMIGILRGSRPKTAHRVDIVGVYVEPGERGKGLGGLLLEGALKEITSSPGTVKVVLSVNPEQKAAVRLYKRAGFKEVGRLRRELRIGDRYFDELVMEKQIR